MFSPFGSYNKKKKTHRVFLDHDMVFYLQSLENTDGRIDISLLSHEYIY